MGLYDLLKVSKLDGTGRSAQRPNNIVEIMLCNENVSVDDVANGIMETRHRRMPIETPKP